MEADMPDLKLPELGENIDEADVLKVLVSEGDIVAVDQPLIEIETEKATLEVPAETAGTVTKIHVKAGRHHQGGPGDRDDRAGRRTRSTAEGRAGARLQPKRRPTGGAERPPNAPRQRAVRREPAPVAAPTPAKEAPRPAHSPRPPPRRPASGPPSPSPSVRKLAREIGVDIGSVAGSGPGGRISDDDVKRASRERPAPVRPPALVVTAAVEFRQLPDFTQWGKVTREPLTRLRRTVSRNMAQSWTEIPHVHLQHHADITAMEELRQQYKERARRPGGNLTISVMMLKIVASALRAFPRVNSSYDPEAQELILKDYVHIGVAVDTDRGLVVPKIENVDEKNIIELSVELNEIAERARAEPAHAGGDARRHLHRHQPRQPGHRLLRPDHQLAGGGGPRPRARRTHGRLGRGARTSSSPASSCRSPSGTTTASSTAPTARASCPGSSRRSATRC